MDNIYLLQEKFMTTLLYFFVKEVRYVGLDQVFEEH